VIWAWILISLLGCEFLGYMFVLLGFGMGELSTGLSKLFRGVWEGYVI
jgi:hypothetical protein